MIFTYSYPEVALIYDSMSSAILTQYKYKKSYTTSYFAKIRNYDGVATLIGRLMVKILVQPTYVIAIYVERLHLYWNGASKLLTRQSQDAVDTSALLIAYPEGVPLCNGIWYNTVSYVCAITRITVDMSSLHIRNLKLRFQFQFWNKNDTALYIKNCPKIRRNCFYIS